MAFISMPEISSHNSRTTKITLRLAWIALYPIICLIHEAYLIAGERAEGYIRTAPKPRARTSRWRRRRALSIRNSKPSKSCPLLSLPREVRNQIWRLVIGEPSAVHLGISYLDSDRGQYGLRCGDLCLRRREYSTGRCVTPDDDFWNSSFGIMGCLLSCNQIYSEVIGLVYTLPTFKFGNGYDIAYLPRILLPQRTNLIRNMDIRWKLLDPPSLPSPKRRSNDPVKMEKAKKKNHHYRKTWVSVWSNLAAMEGLVNLKVDVRIGYRRQGCVARKESQSFLWSASDLQIVTKVTRPTTFELFLPAKLEHRVRMEVTAPNLRILPTTGMSR